MQASTNALRYTTGMQTNVERVKDKLDIATVVGGYVTLQKAGALLRARCPFHNEKSPSFTVSPVRQTYHCFGCGEHGDIFTFVQKIEGMDFRESLELLAQKAGITLENEFKGSRQGDGVTDYVAKDEKETLFSINETAALQYEINLKNEREILEYLHSRGLTDKTIETFRLGFAQDAWQANLDALTSREFKVEDVEKVGLALQSTKEPRAENLESRQANAPKRYYDRFRSRIMFPIANAQGKIAGFTGRIWIDQSKERTEEQKEKDATAAKYVNTPETPLYHKSSILYGLHIAKHHIRPLNCVLIVEGQMDLLTCHQVGYTNSVAISGTALTEEQVRHLSRLTKNFLLALDSDKAGVDATIKSIEKALQVGCDIKVVSFNGKDASEVLQKEGAEAVKACVREAVDWCSYLLSVVEKRSEGDTRMRARLVTDIIIPLLRVVESPLERDALLTQIVDRTQLSRESLLEALAKRPAKVPEVKPQANKANESRSQEYQKEYSSEDRPQSKSTSAYSKQPHRELLCIALDIPEVSTHNKISEWRSRLGGLTCPITDDVQAHRLLATFPQFEHALHIEEIIEELFTRAEREEYTALLKDVTEELRSAELAGEDGKVEELAKKAAELHTKLHNIARL